MAGKNLINPARESLLGDIPAGDGKIANLYLQCSIKLNNRDRSSKSADDFSRTGFYLESSMAPLRITVAGGLLTLGDETAFFIVLSTSTYCLVL